MIVVFDSNVWLSELGLRSPLGAVARFYIKQTMARLAVPEVVRLEVEHHLRNRLKGWIDIMEENHRQLLTIFGTLQALIVPDPSEIEAKVNEFFNTLGIDVLDVPFSLASARSSFLKTIYKLPPSSDKNQQFKDGVLWADCVKLLEQDDVCLVTEDKGFYQDRDHVKGLSRSLATEINLHKNQFLLFPSLGGLLALANFRIDLPLEDDLVEQAYLSKNAQAIDSLLSDNGFELGQRLSLSRALYVTEDPSVVYVEFSMEFEAKEFQGFGRKDAVVTFKGDGMYDTNRHIFTSMRNRGDTLRFQLGDGTPCVAQNAFAYPEPFAGRPVSHTVRRKLD